MNDKVEEIRKSLRKWECYHGEDVIIDGPFNFTPEQEKLALKYILENPKLAHKFSKEDLAYEYVESFDADDGSAEFYNEKMKSFAQFLYDNLDTIKLRYSSEILHMIPYENETDEDEKEPSSDEDCDFFEYVDR